jgi:hypothetical protein
MEVMAKTTDTQNDSRFYGPKRWRDGRCLDDADGWAFATSVHEYFNRETDEDRAKEAARLEAARARQEQMKAAGLEAERIREEREAAQRAELNQRLSAAIQPEGDDNDEGDDGPEGEDE